MIIMKITGLEKREKKKNKALKNIERINDGVQMKADYVKDSADHTAQKLFNAINKAGQNTEGVLADIKERQ